MIKADHIYREGNQVADCLAGLDHSLPLGVHSVLDSDPTMWLYLLYDFLGVI
ncbi:hypothetical protein LINGRAHAP2_LOCUS35713 [Linum grandiflorum]